MFIGQASGFNNSTGSDNVAIGNQSSFLNTDGRRNVCIGTNSNLYNDGGSYNVIIGYNAGYGSSSHNKSSNIFIGYQSGYNETGSNKLYIENSSSSSPLIYGEFDNDIVGINGRLGVNTMTPSADAQLHVNGNAIIEGTLYTDGKIWSEEVEVVSSVTWPDYVFENDYSLMTIADLEKFIKTNGHLPEIPKAEEAEQGIKLGEMNAKLLKKIEELTLYMIQQEKRIKELEERIKN